MAKRFTIGFLVGIGVMYWYIHRSDDLFAQTDRWFQRSASGYRGDQTHRAVVEEVGR